MKGGALDTDGERKNYPMNGRSLGQLAISTEQKVKLNASFLPYRKVKLGWVYDLNVKEISFEENKNIFMTLIP